MRASMHHKARWFALILLLVALQACQATAETSEATVAPGAVPSVTAEAKADQPTSAPLIDATATEADALTSEPSAAGCPLDSPQAADGMVRLIFIDADHNLYSQNMPGVPSKLTVSGDVSSAALSADGSQIAYVRESEGFPPELWVANSDGTSAHRVLGAPGIDSLYPGMSLLPGAYDILYHWIPYHSELLIRAYGYTSVEPADETQVSTGVYRLDEEALALAPFAGLINAPFSPDGEWFAISENESLSLIRTDGTGEHRGILDGYREIGLGHSTMLPPLTWDVDRVRVIIPPSDAPALIDPPLEVWDVSLTGETSLIDTVTDADLLTIDSTIAPNGEYFIVDHGNGSWSLAQFGAEPLHTEEGSVRRAAWNPASTHFLYQDEAISLSDICGSASVVQEAVVDVNFEFSAQWIDEARALIRTRELSQGGTVRYYLFSAADNSMQNLSDAWSSAEAVLIP